MRKRLNIFSDAVCANLLFPDVVSTTSSNMSEALWPNSPYMYASLSLNIVLILTLSEFYFKPKYCKYSCYVVNTTVANSTANNATNTHVIILLLSLLSVTITANTATHSNMLLLLQCYC